MFQQMLDTGHQFGRGVIRGKTVILLVGHRGARRLTQLTGEIAYNEADENPHNPSGNQSTIHARQYVIITPNPEGDDGGFSIGTVGTGSARGETSGNTTRVGLRNTPMYLYRGEEIGNRERLTDICLKIILSGESDRVYDILPHIRVLRSPRFFQPLLQLLADGKPDQKEAAAAALGNLGDPECVEALRKAYEGTQSRSRRDSRSLRAAIISALGEVPVPASVDLLVEIGRSSQRKDPFGPHRSRLVIAALGQLTQQGVPAAEDELIRFLSDDDPANRALAATEASLAYWHRPNLIPGTLLQQLFDLTCDRSDEVCAAAAAALQSLAKLGNSKAEILIEQLPLEEETY
jgi:hypothetical protein